MPQKPLQLTEMLPDRTQVWFAIATGCLLLAVGAWVLSLGEIPLFVFPAFMLLFDAVVLIIDLVTATLLFAQASVFKSRAFLVLAAGYLFTALIVIAHALTFPGIFAPTGLLSGGLSSPAWIAVFWRAGFPLSICVYAMLKSKDPSRLKRPSLGIAAGAGGAVFLATVLSVVAMRGSDLLPPLLVSPRLWHYPNFIITVAAVIALYLAAITLLMRERTSRLDVWLLLSLWAWLLQLAMIGSTSGRFTLAWYFTYGVGLLPHVIVMLALIADASRTYARLAISVSARNLERESKLISMEAVAAAIAHEIGQPLAAIAANANAGLLWLERQPPNLDVATQSLRSNAEDARRAFALIKSVRSMLAKRTGQRTTFSLNDLVRETASLLKAELASGQVSLHLELDETLPPILADRVQIQQVLANLFTNAVQSLGAIQGRERQLTVRSASSNGENVLLEVADNGIGIEPAQMAHIFEAFFTTKATGTGIGLALCRIIVEKHGGQLWASHGAEQGATFHLQLPRSGLSAP